jgi:hypothetical protein
MADSLKVAIKSHSSARTIEPLKTESCPSEFSKATAPPPVQRRCMNSENIPFGMGSQLLSLLAPGDLARFIIESLHLFEIRQSPALVEHLLGGTVEAEEREPAFAGFRLHPVLFKSLGRGRPDVNVR